MHTPEIVREGVTKVAEFLGINEKPEDDASLPANAIDLLTMQHREVDALFKAIEQAGDEAFASKNELTRTLIDKLVVHTRIEEAIFYPAVKQAAKDIVLEAFEEHDAAKLMLAKLARTQADHEAFDARICFLKELIQHHVKEEENELFPKVKQALDDTQLVQLGESMIEEMSVFEERLEAAAAPVRRMRPARAASRKKPKAKKKAASTRPATRKKSGAKAKKKVGMKKTASKGKRK